MAMIGKFSLGKEFVDEGIVKYAKKSKLSLLLCAIGVGSFD